MSHDVLIREDGFQGLAVVRKGVDETLAAGFGLVFAIAIEAQIDLWMDSMRTRIIHIRYDTIARKYAISKLLRFRVSLQCVETRRPIPAAVRFG
jgi:hypothetical protein